MPRTVNALIRPNDKPKKKIYYLYCQIDKRSLFSLPEQFGVYYSFAVQLYTGIFYKSWKRMCKNGMQKMDCILCTKVPIFTSFLSLRCIFQCFNSIWKIIRHKRMPLFPFYLNICLFVCFCIFIEKKMIHAKLKPL